MPPNKYALWNLARRALAVYLPSCVIKNELVKLPESQKTDNNDSTNLEDLQR